MSVLSTLKNWFRKGGASLGMIKSLTLVTDDRRIAMDPGEYTRINVAKSTILMILDLSNLLIVTETNACANMSLSM